MRRPFITITLLVIVTITVSWRGSQAAQIPTDPDALIILDAADNAAMQEAIGLIESTGGRVVHVFPPHVLIGTLPTTTDSALVKRRGIKEIHRTTLNPARLSEHGITAQLGVTAWNKFISDVASIESFPDESLAVIEGDMLHPPPSLYISPEIGAAEVGLPDREHTSDYLIGKVAVGIILPESSVDAENWSQERQNQVGAEIVEGANWWAAREPNANLTFFYDAHFSVPTSYEPIHMKGGPPWSEGEEHLWIGEVLTAMGYSTASHNYFDQVRDYVNAIRASYQTDWAFAVFVVDSLNDIDGKFSNGYFAYAYVGGPFAVMAYDNDGYIIDNMDAVLAHEMGHVFWALDQYKSLSWGFSSSECKKTSGVLEAPNENQDLWVGQCALDVNSIMRGGVSPYTNAQVDHYTRGQIGWWDEDGNGVLDPLDRLPTSTDAASFVSDVSLPHGTVVSPGQSLVKTWRMKNTGSSTWGTGYQLAFVNGEQMGAPNAVDVPTTAPGHEVDISVNMTAPTSNGDHTGYWRLRNPDGTYFGDQVWIQINVQTASSYITTLSADPPSPSNSSSVRIHARVENFPNFRAMRLKIDGGDAYELGAPEFYYDWNTSGYAAGDHSIVVEVADQTDTSWSHPETRGMTYTLEGTTGSNNHAPNRPILIANPAYDWYVTIGSPPQLCAQEQGDPDGDAITQYRFVASASVGTADSGWVGGPCHTFSSLTPGTYEWHTQVKDSQGGISDWSDTWHFTVEPTGVTAYIDHFSPVSPSNAEEVKIYGCSSGHAGVNVTLRVLVNDANDGTDSGQWHIIKEQGSPCFNDVDVPIWRTLEYADGPHLVRVLAMAIQPDAGDVYDEVYMLNHRRPDSTRLVAPVPISRDIREAIYLNSRTITFQWEPTIRAQSYTLHIGTNPSPEGDTNPVFRQTFASSVTEQTITFAQDYPTLYWQVEATNDVGSNASGDQLFGIDRVEPSCTVQSLSGTTYESVFQVNWNGSDNLADVRTFDIQYMDSSRGTWEDWLTGIPSTKTYELFTGQPGHTYYYRCRTTDSANNMSTYPTVADTSTTIDPSARPPTPWWDSAYNGKRNLIIQNNMPGVILPAGYPVHLHFDSATTPTAAELFGASQSTPECNDLRIVHNDAAELDRVVQNCSSSAIDIWFRTQVEIPGGSSDNMAHQLYYGNASAAAPPADSNQVWYPYLEADTTYLYFFQEGSGSTAYDSSGNNRHCSIDSTVQWSTGKFGNGLRFNRANYGDSRSLNCGSAIPTPSFTIDFWYKPDPDDGGYITAELAGGGNGGGGNNWLLQNFEGRLRLDVWPCPTCGSSEVRSNFNLHDSQYVNKWNHLAVTFNGVNEVRFNINGNLDSTKYLPQSGINTYTPPLEIGSAEGIRQVKANIGAFRISDGVKTSFPYGAFAAITNEPTTAAGAPIAPPITGSPDLAVLSLATYPNPGGGVLIQAVVENQGNVNTQNGFYTDLYLDHLPTGSGDFTGSIRFWVNDPIAAGATATLTTVMTNLSALGGAGSQSAAPASETSGTLYAQADSVGAVTEPDETNNIYSAGTEICVATTDAYESDDGVESASVISVGQTQMHNFDRPGDQDWVKFEAEADASYVFRTFNIGPTSDTYLYLYDTDGATVLTSNDDYGGSLASQIRWTAPSSSTYYVLIQHWNPNTGGCGTIYDLTVELDLAYDVFLPLIAR